jgi:hypothetical protein
MNHSCFTPESLVLLKNAYNKHHAQDPSKQIISKDAREIWEQLNVRLPHCEKETCWLNQLNDSNIQKQMEQLLFAPLQPAEWRENPTEWLSNYDILDVLEQYEIAYPSFLFLGPTPIDFDKMVRDKSKYVGKTCVWRELCQFSLQKQYNKSIRKIGVIFNLDEHDESGSHWVSLFIDLDEHFIFYFDSTGAPIPAEIKRLVERVKEQGQNLLPKPIHFDYIHSTTEHQQENTECGMYSLFFLITILTRDIDGQKIKTTEELINTFTGKYTKGSKKKKRSSRKSGEKGGNMSTNHSRRKTTRARIPDGLMEKYRSVYFSPPV